MKQQILTNLRLFLLMNIVLFSLMMGQAYADKAGTQDKHSPLLRSYSADYIVSGYGMDGISVKQRLSTKQNNYQFENHSTTIGLFANLRSETRDEISQGVMVKLDSEAMERNADAEVKPQLYTYQKIVKNKVRKDIKITFDWPNQSITNHDLDDKNKWQMEALSNTQDNLSYRLALSLILKKNDKPQQFTLPVADGGHIKHYQFEVLEKENIETPMGIYHAVKVRHTRSSKDRVLTLWCVKELDYVPVRIEQQEPDKPLFVSTIQSFKFTD